MFSSNVFDTRPRRQRIGVEHARVTRLARDLPVDLVTEFKRQSQSVLRISRAGCLLIGSREELYIGPCANRERVSHVILVASISIRVIPICSTVNKLLLKN